MRVRRESLKVQIAVIKGFEILGLHILSGIEGGTEISLHGCGPPLVVPAGAGFCGYRTIRLMLFPDSEESVTQDRNIYNINNKTANGFCRNFCDNKGS